MFTGIIKGVGTIASRQSRGGGYNLDVLWNNPAPFSTGDSLAVNGICLTVEKFHGVHVMVSLSPETLARSDERKWRPGTPVNLEPALRAGDPMGGHMVQGHVDGVATLRTIRRSEFWDLSIEIPGDLSRYCVEKGSISLDGVSLTISRKEDSLIGITAVPHTVENTTLKYWKPTSPIHVEVDILAKYVEQFSRDAHR